MIEFVLQKYERMAEECREKLEMYQTQDVPIREGYRSALVERHALLNMFVMELKNLKSILRLLETLPDKEEER